MKYSVIITFEQLLIVISIVLIGIQLIKVIRTQNEIIKILNNLKGGGKNE